MNCIFKKVAAFAVAAVTAFSGISVSSTSEVNAAEKKLIALTFDDGPNTTTTNQVLDILEENGALASFFLIGTNINAESALSVKRAYDMGCEIDNHSKTHPTMSGMSAEEIKEEVSYVDDKVFEITGEHTHFFRPPFIAVSDTMYENIDLPFICGFDCKDFMENVTAEQRAEAVINGAKDGLIVLLHDAAGNDQTVEALKTIIPELKKEGYEFVTLTQLFEMQGETPRGDILYSEVPKYPCSSYTHYKNIFEGEVSGGSGDAVWGSSAVLDLEELSSLGNSYAIQVDYDSTTPPVITLQKWSGTPVWSTVQPLYFNGSRACFMAEDIIKALDEAGVGYTDLDKLSIAPYGDRMTMTAVDILVNDGGHDTGEIIPGDVNSDGSVNAADLLGMQKFILGIGELKNYSAGDLDNSGSVNIIDLILLKNLLV